MIGCLFDSQVSEPAPVQSEESERESSSENGEEEVEAVPMQDVFSDYEGLKVGLPSSHSSSALRSSALSGSLGGGMHSFVRSVSHSPFPSSILSDK